MLAFVEDLEAIPGKAQSDVDPIPATVATNARHLLAQIPELDERAVVATIQALAAAAESLANQQDAPRLAEVALDLRLVCHQAAATLDARSHRYGPFRGLLDRVANDSPYWSATQKCFVAEFASGVHRFTPQLIAHSGFGYLEAYSLMRDLVVMSELLLTEINRTHL